MQVTVIIKLNKPSLKPGFGLAILFHFQNPLTGEVEETFKTPYTNPQHELGGQAKVSIY